jgi:hypothetical protein
MRKMFLLLLLALVLVSFAGGCVSQDKGSREYIPGKGWVPTVPA